MKTATATRNNWADYLKFFSEQNNRRLTRLGVFVREGDSVQDYWIEDGLPLMGIAFEINADNLPVIEIILGDKNSERHLTHIIKGARRIKFELNLKAGNDGLEITDAEDKTTILRFENF